MVCTTEMQEKLSCLQQSKAPSKRKHPAHTPVHELVHIGIEEIIVQRFKLSHWEKERTVDLVTSKMFGQVCYQVMSHKTEVIEE